MSRSSLSQCRCVGLSVLWLLLFIRPGLAAETDVVINEIMYHPPLDLEELQYIELWNRGATDVDISKWEIRGAKFTFPQLTILHAGGYLVVCRNAALFSANYGANVPAVGDFSGKLSHGGETLSLCNAAGAVIEKVNYGDSSPWPLGPDGYSASLERICPFASGELTANWAGSKLPPVEKPAGTPGRKNDNFSTNLPPVIADTTFRPPSVSQPLTITTRVTDERGVKSVSLLWRTVQPGGETPETELAMQRTRRRRPERHLPGGDSRPTRREADPVSHQSRKYLWHDPDIPCAKRAAAHVFLFHIHQHEHGQGAFCPAPERLPNPDGFSRPRCDSEANASIGCLNLEEWSLYLLSRGRRRSGDVRSCPDPAA